MKAEEQADTLIEEFNAWFQSLPNDPLLPPERAILKTFIYFLGSQKNKTAVPIIEKEEDHAAPTNS